MLKRFYIIAVVLVIIAGLSAWLATDQADSNEGCVTNPDLITTELKYRGTTFIAEIAETPAQKQQGLSGRNCIDKDRAMLFNYELTGDYCFWMKNMNFPIDIIWLDDENKIVTVHENVSPDTYPNSFCPDRPANTILEFAQGTYKSYGMSVGSQFEFSLP